MRYPFLLALLAAGCGSGTVGNAADRAAELAVQTATLTGLYESEAPGQLCILDRGAGNARFGLVLNGTGGACSGAGSAVGADGAIRLAMAGDEPCEISAGLAGGRVAFPDVLPPGCAYYCAPGTTMAGADFVKTGGTAADAMRAQDLVGDPLCGGLGTP